MELPTFLVERIHEILAQPDAVRRRGLQELCHGHPVETEAIVGLVRDLEPGRPDLLPTLTAIDAGGIARQHNIPDQIGPYKILEPIGEGGMGMVYLAEQVEELRRRVALKLVRTGLDTKDVVARFEAERQALALMNHPNIARVYEAGSTTRGEPYFAMEYVPGVAITQYCDAHRLTTAERLDLMIDVCSGIHHAHENGIIHRDIKPSNVLVMRMDGRAIPKIIDFGVAKAINQRLTQKTIFTQRGLIVGTPEYMSPEQAEMTGGDVDARSDVYSLGVLLYELLVGELPYDMTNLHERGLLEIQRRIVQDQPSRPSTRVRQLGTRQEFVAHRRRTSSRGLTRSLRGPLDWIVLKALEKNPARRYESASAMANDIARLRQRQAVSAGPRSPIYRFRTIAGRHQAMLALGLAIVLLLVATLSVVLWQVGQTSDLLRLLAEKDQEIQRLRASLDQVGR